MKIDVIFIFIGAVADALFGRDGGGGARGGAGGDGVGAAVSTRRVWAAGALRDGARQVVPVPGQEGLPVVLARPPQLQAEQERDGLRIGLRKVQQHAWLRDEVLLSSQMVEVLTYRHQVMSAQKALDPKKQQALQHSERVTNRPILPRLAERVAAKGLPMHAKAKQLPPNVRPDIHRDVYTQCQYEQHLRRGQGAGAGENR